MDVSSRNPWTDADKFEFLMKIIESQGGWKWDNIPIPEGRTVTACKKMIQKERGKLKSGKKRKNADEAGVDDEEAPETKAKKPRTPRGRKVEGGPTKVKEEPKGEDSEQEVS